MRKIFTPAFIFIISFTFCKAQLVAIPDTNFVKFLTTNYPTCMAGNMLDTTCTNITNATTVNCEFNAIVDLTGIQYFDKLKFLDCGNNLLTNLSKLPSSLLTLNCAGNQLDTLPALSSTLLEIRCNSNLLTSLPALPTSLFSLNCSNNELTALPLLPSSLDTLFCGYNNSMTSLPTLPSSLKYLNTDNLSLSLYPALPSSLTYLSCLHNGLTSLPALPASLFGLYCVQNNLTLLPALPAGLDNIDCDLNPDLKTLPALPNSLTSLSCSFGGIKVLPALPASLLYLICSTDDSLAALPALPSGLVFLSCSSDSEITTLPDLPDSLFFLDVSYDTHLTCLPRLNTIEEFYCNNTSLNCLINYGKVHISTPTITTFPICNTGNDTYGCLALNGINQLSVNNEQVTVFPNPVEDELTINYNSLANGELYITNVVGQTILVKNISAAANQTIIDVSHLNTGLYFAVFKAANGNKIVTKFVKE